MPKQLLSKVKPSCACSWVNLDTALVRLSTFMDNALSIAGHLRMIIIIIVNVCLRWDTANVSETVTFQASGLPRDHGVSVALSGRFSSVLVKPTGSLTTGTRLIALQMITPSNNVIQICMALSSSGTSSAR